MRRALRPSWKLHGTGWAALASAAVLMLAVLAGCARQADPRLLVEHPLPTPVASAPSVSVAPPIVPTATAAQTGAPGLPNVGASVSPTPPPQVYTVQRGDTLSTIAARFGIDLDALIKANGLGDPNSLKVGQRLKIPSSQIEVGPATELLPDSEFVDSPAYVGFLSEAVCTSHNGYLCHYSEKVGGDVLTGPEVVDRIASEYSVGPRMLLAVLESKSGWVTDPDPVGQALVRPMGYRPAGTELLSRQLAWAANELNKGYYDWRGRGVTPISWGDGTATAYAPSLNAATVGLQYFFSLNASQAQWETWVGVGPGSFAATYRSLFGDPGQNAIEPLIPADTVQPSLRLPWSGGETWFYTSGPHGGWGEGSAWAAIDAVPDEGYLGCQPAKSWATAAAAGLVVQSNDGMVLIDLDEDGHEETGWVLLYLHVASRDRVPAGTRVKAGDQIGHPSCEGGFGNATHLHFARKYRGEWIAADGPLPMVLGGWTFQSSGTSYEGTAVRGSEQRTACECQRPDFNGLTAD